MANTLQFSSVAQSCMTLCDPMKCSSQDSQFITNAWSLIKIMSITLVMPSNHLILCRPLLFPPSTFRESGSFQMSQFFPSGGQSIRVSASALVFQSYSGLIFFRMNWLDLLEVQGTLESLPQHHSSKASILQHSAFFIVQVSQPYMTTGQAQL